MTDEATRTFFYVPKANWPKLERAVEKLSKRSQKAGGWAIELTRFGTRDGKDGQPDCYEVFLDAPDVRLEGYRFIARLDHSQETGNIIRMLPNIDVAELPGEYRNSGPKCDHCQINRLRRDTFVLQKEDDGSFVQLGSSCMAEFFKTDPRAIMKLAEIVGYAREAMTASEDADYYKRGKFTLRDLRFIDLNQYLLQCASAMRRNRNFFVSSRAGSASTKATALRELVAILSVEAAIDAERSPIDAELMERYETVAPTDEDRATVAKAMEWVELLAERRDNNERLSQFEHNILVVGEATVIEKRACGLAAAIVGCFERAMKEIERAKAPLPVYKPEPKPEPVNVGDMTGMIALFTNSKLQYPKITISFENTGVLVLSRAGANAAVPGSITVCSEGGYGNNTRFGRIHANGRWEPNRYATQPEGLEAALMAFAADPAGVAAAYGHRSGNCCFCHKKLTDPRSADVGYGATCAKNWGMPYPTQKEMRLKKTTATSALALAAAA